MTKLPVLVSVQLPVWDVPEPEVNLHEPGPAEGDTAGEAQSLANQGDSDLNNPAYELIHGSAQQNDQQAVDQEATGVGLTEEVALLDDEAQSGESAPEFGQSLCNATGSIASSLSSFNSVTQLYANLGQDGTTASADLAKRIADAINDFTSVFGPCIDTLDVAERIVEDIDKVFCEGGD